MYRKKIVKFVLILLIVFALSNILIHFLCYHEANKASEVSEIRYYNYLGEYKLKEAKDKKEIEREVKKVNKLNFFPSKTKQLQESPTSSIYINYIDGTMKTIYIAGYDALIMTKSSSGVLEKGLSKFYYVNPMEIDGLFK